MKTKVDEVMPIVGELLDREWKSLLKPFLMKRISLYLKEIEKIQKEERPFIDYNLCDGVED